MSSRTLASLWLILLAFSPAWGEASATLAGSIGEQADSTAQVRAAMAEARRLSHEGRLSEAIARGTAVLQTVQARYGSRSRAYAQALSDVAGFYSRSGRYQEALRMGNEALELRRALSGEHHIDYANSLNNVARYYAYLGQPMKAVGMGRKAMELKEVLVGTESADYAKSVSNLAGYLSRVGNYAEAIRLGQEALDIRRRTLGPYHPDCIESLNNLSRYHYFRGEYDEAIQLEQQALQALRASTTDEPPVADATDRQPPVASPVLRANIMSNLADYYLKTGRQDEAMRYGEETMLLRREVLGEHHPDYAESLGNMATCHYEQGNYAEAVRLQRQALQLQQQLLGKEHPSYAQSLCKMALCYLASEQADSAEVYAFKATNRYMNVILSTFANLTASERDLYWKKVRPWFTNTILLLAEKIRTERMLVNAFNGTLLAKGLLLKSELEMTSLLMESGDSTAVYDYRALQTSRSLLLSQFELPVSQRTLDTDSLQEVIVKQERRLVKRSKTYGNYTRQMRTGWQRVALQLAPDELAVEFVHYNNDSGSGQYAALIVGRQSRHPELVPLMDDEQLHAVATKDVYNTPKLSQLLWKPLEHHLAKARRVFFAPAGELYNIAVESLPLWDGSSGEVMSDRWQLYRLSSTRQLVVRRAGSPAPPTAIVYGGITYDARPDADQMDASSDDDDQSVSSYDEEEALAGQSGLRYLPGTKREAEEIASVLRSDSIPTTVRLAEEASEHSLKSLSGRAPTLLHIATHGFYWTESDIQASSVDQRLQFLSADARLDDTDRALTRSGLFFAGANRTLLGLRRNRLKNDGVLTAQEISLLDLRGLDLLVLSACQTGLGQVTGDGVFGLQRGFKKAGAQTLLMSLWKVDDRATRILMTSFYRYLSAGRSKHEALRMAQHDLRTMQVESVGRRGRHAISARAKRARNAKPRKQYEDPYFWAAFILLDDI